MNIRQLRCAVLLAKGRSFSNVAEQMGISQPALSKHIANLENELGLKLFERGSSIALTPAGEHFIAEAEELIYKEEQLMRTMERYASGEKGRLVIGISPFRGVYLLPNVVCRLRERFPDLQIVIRELGSEQLHEDIAKGLFDFAVLNMPADEALLDLIPMPKEDIVLAVPKSMCSLICNRPPQENPLPEVALSDCLELPFVALGKQQILRQLFDKLCMAEGVVPNIAVEAVGISTAWAMVKAGAGAAILPVQILDKNPESEVCLYRLKRCLTARQPVVAIRKGQKLSDYAKYAVELLTK